MCCKDRSVDSVVKSEELLFRCWIKDGSTDEVSVRSDVSSIGEGRVRISVEEVKISCSLFNSWYSETDTIFF